MSIIGTPLPITLTNGTLADADQVQQLFEYITAQVNANATEGGALSEWVTLTDIAAFVSTTFFDVAGDVTTLLPPGRALRITCSVGIVYAFVFTSTYDGSANTTSVQIFFRTDDLDSGLSLVEYGVINSEPRSTPVETVLTASRASSNQTLTAPSVATVIFNSIAVNGQIVDSLGEFNTATGEWTAMYTGHYRLEGMLTASLSSATSVSCIVAINGVVAASNGYVAANTGFNTIGCAVNAYVEAGDVVTVCVTSAADVTVLGTNSHGSRLMVTRLNGV